MISIISVTYNNFDGLLSTFASIKNIKINTFEWIVIDGGSSDRTSEFLSQCEYVSKFISESDDGIYDAMLKGLKLASGNRIIFLNAGDVFSDCDALEYIEKHNANYEVCFYSCRMVGIGMAYIRSPRPLSSASYSVPAVQQATVYQRDLLLNLEWPANFKVCGDYAIAAQLLIRKATSVCDDRVVAQFELGGVSTFRPMALAVEAYQIQSQILKLPPPLKVLHFSRRLLTGYFVLALYRLRSLLN